MAVGARRGLAALTDLIRSQPFARSWRGTLASHDALAVGYSLVVFGVTLTSSGPAQAACLLRVATAGALVVVAAVIGRVLTEVPSTVRAQLYRLALAAVVVDSYLILRDLLPLVRPDTVDATLHAIDEWLFGFSPALWFERFNRRPIVEWFSFFYFSYFWICGGYLLTVLWLLKPGRRTSVFAIGSMLVMFCGQLCYMLVPGYGPLRELAHAYEGPLDGGFFWSCVWQTVQTGSAMKDIFPSLHTAMPTWFTAFALWNARRDPRWRPVATITAFFAINIIISTMLLRWHYAIDIVAGLVLAGAASWAAPRIAAREAVSRRLAGLPPVWRF